MSRPLFHCSTLYPYHVAARCINRDWFSVPLESIWAIMCEELYFVKHAFQLKIFSFVLMSNHFHLLVSSPRGNLSEAMKFFLSQTGWRIPKAAGRINQTWAKRFKRSEIQSYMYFLNCYKYIYRNPVESRSTNSVEEYRYSTLSGKIGLTPILIPVEEDTILFNGEVEKTLQWLNRTPRKEDVESMRKALRRRIFKYPKVNAARNPLEKDNALL